MKNNIEFGRYIQQLRKEKNYTLKVVADKLEIDVSMLSKIEHGERNVNSIILKRLSKIFNLDFRKLQMEFLQQKIHQEYGNQPFLKETLINYLEKF
jgi:transcriptional regulator with XRE-family HTH domain